MILAVALSSVSWREIGRSRGWGLPGHKIAGKGGLLEVRGLEGGGEESGVDFYVPAVEVVPLLLTLLPREEHLVDLLDTRRVAQVVPLR